MFNECKTMLAFLMKVIHDSFSRAERGGRGVGSS